MASTGAQSVVAPVAAVAAAALPGRETPFDWLKLPPKYTVEAVAATANTSPFAEPAKLLMIAPVAVSKATRRFFETPLTVVKAPTA